MSKPKRISRRRGVQMGTSDTGIFESYYEECGLAAEVRPAPCLRTILCECNRRRCIGRTHTFAYYTRKLQEA